VATPQKDDVILYFNAEESSDPKLFEHIGLVSKVENGKTWVQSKWGNLNCYEHLEEIVPQQYGNAAAYLRKN
jgi:hypothetical protein